MTPTKYVSAQSAGCAAVRRVAASFSSSRSTALPPSASHTRRGPGAPRCRGPGRGPVTWPPVGFLQPACPAVSATLAALVEATDSEHAWTADMLAGLADTGTTLAVGTELVVDSIAFAAEGPAFAQNSPCRPTTTTHPNSRRLLVNMPMSLLARLEASHPTAARRSSSASTQARTRCSVHGR